MSRVLPIAIVGALAPLVLGVMASACAEGKASSPAWNELEAIHATPAVREAAELAPVPFAAAERARFAAERACDEGHETKCDLAVDQALAGYALTEATARAVRAKARATTARASLADQTRAADAAAAARATAERDAAEVSAELEVATHVPPPRASGPAPAAREEARRRAAASLAEEAELLCDAARLLGSPSSPGAIGAGAPAAATSTDDDALTKLRASLAEKTAPGGPILDDATRARAACLTQLSTARAHPAAGTDTDSEALLAAISARGLGDDVSAHRDERGVLVDIAAAFDHEHLSAHATETLKALASLAVAHPGVAVQLVAHDAAASPGAPETEEHRALVERRLDEASHALDAAGVPAARRHALRAFARLPLVDPADATHRARNERLEVVLVTR